MIGYPTKKKMNPVSKPVETARRGISFEEDINQSNMAYLDRNLAVIHKKPTPITIVKVDYPSRSKFIDFTNNQERKSLPYAWIKTHGVLVPYNYLIPVNYLTVLDSFL